MFKYGLEEQISKEDVESVLSREKFSQSDFLALISPQANDYLEVMAQKAQSLTKRFFGQTRGIYIPLYLSNACHNNCSYCGFSSSNIIRRKTLKLEEIKNELLSIYKRGYRNILLVSGELKDFNNIDYLNRATKLAVEVGFSSVAVEFGALESDQARLLQESGADQFVLYQETYHPPTYKDVHISGQKSNLNYRIEGVERSIEAGFKKVTLGFLGGLFDYRFEALTLFSHLRYLKSNFWNISFSISIPRLQNAFGLEEIKYPLEDRDFVRVLLAFRLAFPQMPILLSTRESETIRGHLLNLCATNISAESKTSPGDNNLEQFSVTDNRSLEEIIISLKEMGLNPCFKDWDELLPRLHNYHQNR
ncbi:MAG: 2-iminoacetate synthase ThiH [Epsilonproteobacteria bacterium]|nr:MAG: 2-iminoacetate synthase ThiH [Campylobacterota bacterium]RLA67686.1 MAG: 2-iminoacetate synthase ThiH [Campylobacterota bacterium]